MLNRVKSPAKARAAKHGRQVMELARVEHHANIMFEIKHSHVRKALVNCFILSVLPPGDEITN